MSLKQDKRRVLVAEYHHATVLQEGQRGSVEYFPTTIDEAGVVLLAMLADENTAEITAKNPAR